MAKEVAGLIKLQIKGGAANPSPPVGPALGSKGINIMEFCKQFNARTTLNLSQFKQLNSYGRSLDNKIKRLICVVGNDYR